MKKNNLYTSLSPDPGDTPIIAEHISKSYNKGTAPALSNVSLTVKKGELFGLIGPDGAGKTTLFRILTTLLLADSGQARISGYDVVKDFKQIRSTVGYMPGKFSLYQDLTVQENLTFFAALFGTEVATQYELIRDIYDQIEPFKNRRAGKLSGGMKQKLALCCALIHKPSVLFLDEPTTGVDVVSRREFWEMLQKLKRQGITILVSTPYMEEAVLCDRIALIQNGQLLNIDTPSQITGTFPAALYAVKAASIYTLLKDLRSWNQVESCYAFGEWLHVTLRQHTGDARALIREYAAAKAHQQVTVQLIAPTIEDSFIRLATTNPLQHGTPNQP
ncbi:ABC transporter ATP-binding protein [Niabella drilacis]|uniref:ABC-type multidrug transport system, ATPase component n=1 Tax=Niabella drilacis (strain DSM 25811 / CCM 8410 / CCUG 62505 / LMG 26954 / E90) TaxID=1285928 RepID=A0A1G6L9T8_NIADE|nr:ABC transporter ATP-binding protein [Niabella drilacis]SDC39883.1 ABC-type multidrug transport system, ATPase component [Niabella drilacis]